MALAASGTVSLELAAAGTPMIIAYAANPLTAWLTKRLVRIDTPTLVNLVTETRVVPDYLFEKLHTGIPITPAHVAELLADPTPPRRRNARSAVARLKLLGRGGEPPGLRAARSVLAAIGRETVRGREP